MEVWGCGGVGVWGCGGVGVPVLLHSSWINNILNLQENAKV